MMNIEKFLESKVYTVIEILFQLVLINLLWLFTSSIGLFLFTLFPAAMTTYILTNSIVYGKDYPLIKTFFIVFKKEFWRAQKLFLVLLIIGIIVYLDIEFFFHQALSNPSFIHSLLAFMGLFFGLLFLCLLLHLGPVYVYFPKLSTIQTVKMALLLSIRYIIPSFALLVLVIIQLLIIYYFPLTGAILFLLFFSSFSYLSLYYLKPKYQKLIEGTTPLLVSDYNY